MKKNFIKQCLGGTLAVVFSAGALLAPAGALATEPTNNNKIWTASLSNTDMSIYQGTAGAATSWNTLEYIDTVGDNDYHIVSCGGNQTLRSVGIGLTHTAGDLDIKAYRLDGTLLGSSSSISDYESVDVLASGQKAVVLRVFGFNNATNIYRYRISAGCY